jgi:hypothetical protein
MPTAAQIEAVRKLQGQRIDSGEVLSEPSWHEDTQEWRCLVAPTPRGPLLLVALRITFYE